MDLLPLDEPVTSDKLITYLSSHVINRAGGVRTFYQLLEDSLLLSVNSENFSLPVSMLDATKLLTDLTHFEAEQLIPSITCLEFAEMLTKLINEGYYFIQQEE